MGVLMKNGIQYTGGAQGFTKYSTEEQVIGEWIDGKPVYQKTIVAENYPLTTGVNIVSTGISNIDVLVRSDIFVTNSAHTNFRHISHTEVNTQTGSVSTDTIYAVITTSGDVQFYCLNTWSSPNIYITLQYTKTTD